jgi:hypothetical protein
MRLRQLRPALGFVKCSEANRIFHEAKWLEHRRFLITYCILKHRFARKSEKADRRLAERYSSTKLKHTNNRDHRHDVTPFLQLQQQKSLQFSSTTDSSHATERRNATKARRGQCKLVPTNN